MGGGLSTEDEEQFRPCIASVSQMSTISSDQQFRAYELLRTLDTHTAKMMSEVVYGATTSDTWKRSCDLHRQAFEDWMAFAATMHAPEPTDAE